MRHAVLRLPSSIVAQLTDLFRRAAPNEQGAFLLIGHAVRGDELYLYAKQLLPPPAGAWRIQGQFQLAPNNAWVNEVLDAALVAGLGLAFIHSHADGPPELSRADEWMHETFVPPVLDVLGGRPFASLVFSKGKLGGAAWFEGRRAAVDRVMTVGSRLEVASPTNGPTAPAPADDRQVRWWGEDGQALLARLRVAVVGVSGTGTPTAEQLVRMGVGGLVLVEPDVIEPPNVTRMYGTRLADVGRAKVQVLAEHLNAIRDTPVRAVRAKVESKEAIELLTTCDVVFGCTDLQAPRATLNDLALQHLVPYIDVGCGIGHMSGRTASVCGEVRIAVPDSACLWCAGVLDARRLRQECMAPDELAEHRHLRYIPDATVQPSVIPITTFVATLGILRFLELTLGLMDWPDERLYFELFGAPSLFWQRGEVKHDCVCRARLGIGDLRPIGRQAVRSVADQVLVSVVSS